MTFQCASVEKELYFDCFKGFVIEKITIKITLVAPHFLKF